MQSSTFFEISKYLVMSVILFTTITYSEAVTQPANNKISTGTSSSSKNSVTDTIVLAIMGAAIFFIRRSHSFHSNTAFRRSCDRLTPA